MPNDKLTLTFATTAGDLVDEFPANQPLHAAKTTVMAKLKLDPSRANDYEVVFAGQRLDESKKLGELGLQSGAVLVLQLRELVKI